MAQQQIFGVWILRLMSALSGLGFLVVATIGTFQPSWVRFAAVALGAVSLTFAVLVPTGGAHRNFIVRSYLVLLLAGVFAVGLTIQPFALGTLTGFVFLGIAVGIASYKELVPAVVLSVMAMILGACAILLRSGQPGPASVVFVIVGVTSLAAVFGFRRVASAATAEAVADSLRDPLTSATNRRGMVLGTGLLTALAQRSGQRMGCVLIDVDHFKSVNDSHGHEAGDKVLVAIAGAIQTSSRQGDLLVRLGGDEFALFAVVPGTDELAIVAERIRTAVEQLDVTPPVTVCVGGVAPVAGADWDLDELLRQADTQLYAAKDKGRNTISIT
jgi:diguanylate cyclase (GGDEF)-like protein